MIAGQTHLSLPALEFLFQYSLCVYTYMIIYHSSCLLASRRHEAKQPSHFHIDLHKKVDLVLREPSFGGDSWGDSSLLVLLNSTTALRFQLFS